jgi:protocatechuate 3,4-dioxygenase beta subunit
MKRKDFLKNGLIGVSSIIGISAITGHGICDIDESLVDDPDCNLSPRETRGPFPTKTPTQLVQANIKADRTGIALLINLTIQNKNNSCKPLPGAIVDIWHCDKDGNYSEYGRNPMQRTDFTQSHFLRGRQTADEKGRVSFLSIYPGWYRGRAPHLHLEIFNSEQNSLLVTQVAFPENVSKHVYGSTLYVDRGEADTSNQHDNVFADSLYEQLASVTGNITDGFTLTKTIIVKA